MHFEELARCTLEAAARDLLPSFMAPGTRPQGEHHRIAAVIGFSGDHLRGTFGVAANLEGLDAVRRLMGASEGPGAAEDAIGELANLIIGQLKRSWSKQGALITISTPLVVRGLAIEICGLTERHWTCLNLAAGERQLSLWIDAHPGEELALGAGEDQAASLDQGQALLF